MPHGPAPAHRPAPLPRDEGARLEALHSFAVLDTAPEPRYDDLTRLASQVTGMPMAALSLVDEDRQWFKSRLGVAVEATPRDSAFCAHALLQPDALLVVPDTAADARFRDNPMVTGGPRLRSYAGAPLVGSDAQPLGTLCVLDTVPRVLGERELSALAALARQAVAQLEATRAARRLAAVEAALLRRGGRPGAQEPPVEGLERALDRGELVVHYQPLWDVVDSGSSRRARVSGAEALVRWQHPERGLLLPGAFVPAMEAQGLAGRLGEQVLGQVLARAARWDGSGLLPEDFRVHVNVAAQQLHEGATGHTLSRLFASTGAAPGRLALEITETTLLDAAAFTPDAARALVAQGVALALDDFGTGFSSLTQLRSYPFSCVKVDRSFVAGLGRSPEDEVIVDAVVALATRLGLAAVCEGVETPAQLDRVLASGCTRVQGWLLGRAVEPEQWEADLLRRAPQVLGSPRLPRPRAAAQQVRACS